jgi:hypothetical protein
MIDDIIAEKERLDKELKVALATMEKKDTINEIKAKIKINQSKCPHFDAKYNFTWVDDTCPYCGKKHVGRDA